MAGVQAVEVYLAVANEVGTRSHEATNADVLLNQLCPK
jgi:hypothetical protein